MPEKKNYKYEYKQKNGLLSLTRPGIIATLTLNPSIDRYYTVDSPKLGETNRTSHAYVAAGGKGINVSRKMKELGYTTVSYFPYGGATGAELCRMVSGEGLVSRCIETRCPTRINVKVTDGDGVTTEFNEPGGVIMDHELGALISSLEADLGMISLLVISGSVPHGTDPVIYNKIIASAHAAGVPVVLDTSGDALFCGLNSSPELIKPNRRELSELTHRPLLTFDSVFDAADEINKKYGTDVLCTVGECGAVYSGVLGHEKVSAKKVEVISTVGAGDAFLSGFLDGILSDLPLPAAMMTGADTAALYIGKHRKKN